MKNQRSRVYVDPTFQKRLLGRVLMYWVAYNITLWHVMFLVNVVAIGIRQDATAPPKGFCALYAEFTQEHLWIIVSFLAMLPLLGRDLLSFSHRIAGPLVRLRITLQAIADSKPVAPLQVRKNDFLSDFLLDFNRMVESWNARAQQQPSAQSDEANLELAEAG